MKISITKKGTLKSIVQCGVLIVETITIELSPRDGILEKDSNATFGGF